MFPCLTLDRYWFIQLSNREIVSRVRISNSCVVLVCATMSRVAKWKIEKAKVKVVFRLQFHATNIPQHGWEKYLYLLFLQKPGRLPQRLAKQM
uniref:Uncharacterized protein n=2 Tax=Helianthus annuus TaxID=4232 RepID=A0A251TN88_HELAN